MTTSHSTTKQIPSNACRFDCLQPVVFADGADEQAFRIEAYDGSIFKHWWWGNTAFDLSGLKFEQKRTPIFDSHDFSRRIGFTTSQEVSDAVRAGGIFLDNAEAQSLRADMKKGFPMQASLNLSNGPVIEQVADGAFAEVNGKRLKGPGAIFRKAKISEISMTPFGAAPNTSSTAMSQDNSTDAIECTFLNKESPMDNNGTVTPMTADRLKTEFAAVHQEVFAAGQAGGQKAERDRFAALQTACGDDAELLVKCFAAGMTTGQAQAARIEKLTATNAELSKRLTESAPTGSQGRVDPAVAEFRNQRPGEAVEKFDEATATDEQLKTRFAASRDLQTEFGDVESYVAFVQADRAGKVRIKND